MSRTLLEKWYIWLVLAPAVLPLVYWNDIMYPLMTPKTLLLRALALAAFGLFAYLALSKAPFYWSRLKRPFAWVPVALLFIAYLSSWFGIDFYHSFWSTFERGDGLVTLSSCVAFFYLFLLAADEVFIKKFIRIVAWVGSLAGLYVLIQWLNIVSGADLSFLVPPNGRVGGTMGNAAFLAAYLGMSFFVTLAALPEYSGWKRKLLSWGAGLQLLGVFLAATRGTMLALLVVGFGVLFYYGVRGSGAYRTWARRGLAGFVVLAALFIVFKGQLATVPFEPIKRIASVSLSGGTVASRLFLWQNLLPEALERPLFGVGAEHISVLFNRVYDPGLIVEEWFDRSHNAYLDYLIQFGIIGLALYLTLLLSGIALSARLMRSNPPGDFRHRLGFFFLLAFATYALQNFFVFDTGVTLWFMLALLALLGSATSTANVSPLHVFSEAKWGGALIGVAMVALIVPAVITPFRANLLAFEAYLYHVVDVSRAHAAIEKGLALDTYADLEYGYNAYFMYTEQQLTLLEGKERLEGYEAARDVLAQNYERYPYDGRTALYLLQVLNSAPPEATVDVDFEYELIAEVIDLSPKRSAPWYILVNMALARAETLSQGQDKTTLYNAAVDTLESYIALVPNLPGPYFVLADLHLALGAKERALEAAGRGKEAYVHNDYLTAKRAIVFYQKVEDWENAEFFLEKIITFSGTADDDALLYDLAKVKYILEKYDESVAIVKELRDRNPELVASDPAFVRAIAPYESR